MDTIIIEKGQILAFIYMGTPIEDVKFYYESNHQLLVFNVAVSSLEAEKMIEKDGNEVKLTEKGIEMYNRYGNYLNYIKALKLEEEAKQKNWSTDEKVKRSVILLNYLSATKLLFAILGYILGVATADQVKSILLLLMRFFEVDL